MTEWVGHLQLKWVGQYVWQSQFCLEICSKNAGLQDSTLSNIARSQVSVPLNSRNSECTYRVELNDIQFVLFEVGLVPLGLKKVK